MKNEAEKTNNKQGNGVLPCVLSSSFQNIFSMIDRGKVIFEKGYLETLGEMKRQGLIEVDLNKDGSSVVRRIA